MRRRERVEIGLSVSIGVARREFATEKSILKVYGLPPPQESQWSGSLGASNPFVAFWPLADPGADGPPRPF